VATPRHRGQEVRLVDDNHVVVAVQDRDVERDRHFVAQLPVEVDVRAGRQRGGAGDHGTVGQDDLSCKHFRGTFGAPPGQEFVDHHAAAKPHPRRAEAVAHR